MGKLLAVRGCSWYSWGARGCSWSSLQAAPRCEWTKGSTFVKHALGAIVSVRFSGSRKRALFTRNNVTREPQLQLLVPRAYRNGCYDDVAILVFISLHRIRPLYFSLYRRPSVSSATRIVAVSLLDGYQNLGSGQFTFVQGRHHTDLH